jgi:hypothetical protein
MLGGDVTPGKFPLITLKVLSLSLSLSLSLLCSLVLSEHCVSQADRCIAKGEELLWDYGNDYWRVFGDE